MRFLYRIVKIKTYTGTGRRMAISPLLAFGLFWLLLFVLYLPAANAGWVSDTLGWLDAVKRQSFVDFVRRKGFAVPSYYYFTQAVTWCLYQIFGSSHIAWHLVQLSLHALNATLLFRLLRGIFSDFSLRSSVWISFAIALLFCVSPAVSEVIVWEAAYHFLQGMLLLLAELLLLRAVLKTGSARYALPALLLYLLSLFSLEYFYIAPALSAALCVYYRSAKGNFYTRKAWRMVIIPQLILLLAYFSALMVFAGASTGRLGNEWTKLPLTYFLVKPPECLFHLLGGRFLPEGWRHAVYKACSSYMGAGVFYAALAFCVFYAVIRFRKMGATGRTAVFLFAWLLLGLLLASPLWFPEHLLIVGDRYLYLLLPPFLALLVLAFYRMLQTPVLRIAVLLLTLALMVPITFSLNRTWQASQEITDRLQSSLTDAPGKITILLNSPASLQGALMAGAGSDGETKLMHNLLYEDRTLLTGIIYEAAAQNLVTAGDSLSIRWEDSSTIRFSLTRPGAFWQYGTDVAGSYANEDFAVNVESPYCCYTLRLLKPANRYRLLYQYAGAWHELRYINQ